MNSFLNDISMETRECIEI